MRSIILTTLLLLFLPFFLLQAQEKDSVLSKDPDLEAARELFQKREFFAIFPFLERILEDEERQHLHAQAWLFWGFVGEESKNFDQWIRGFKEYLLRVPEDHRIRLRLAWAYYDTQDFLQARQELLTIELSRFDSSHEELYHRLYDRLLLRPIPLDAWGEAYLYISSMFFDDSRVYWGFWYGGLAYYEPFYKKAVLLEKSTLSQRGDPIVDITTWEDHLFFAKHKALYRLELQGKIKNIPLPFEASNIIALLSSSHGLLLADRKNGLWLLEKENHWRKIPLPTGEISAVLLHHDFLWVASEKNTIWSLGDNLSYDESMSFFDLSDVVVWMEGGDQLDSFWFGTRLGQLFSWDGDHLENVVLSSSAILAHALSTKALYFASQDETLWVFHRESDQWFSLNLRQEIPVGSIFSLHAADGFLLINASSGFSLLDEALLFKRLFNRDHDEN